MVERSAREHEAVDESDRHANLCSLCGLECGVAGSTVQIQNIPYACVGGRYDAHGLVVGEAEMTHEALIEDRFDGLFVVSAPLRQSADLGPTRGARKAGGSGGSGGARGVGRTRGARPAFLVRFARDAHAGARIVTVHILNMSVQYSISGSTVDEIAASVETAIRGGALLPGQALPTVRALAEDLGVSPTTVASSYKELTRRGIVMGEGRRGTRVRPAPPISGRLPMAVAPGTIDLRTGGPDPALLPAIPALGTIDEGRRLNGGHTHRLYGEPAVFGPLGRVATERLTADGIDASNIAVVAGALDGVERVLGAWLRPGDRVAVEDPGYTAVLDLLAALGYRLVPLAVDEHGATPGRLEAALDRGVAAVVLTPRAQNPTGAAWDSGAVERVAPRARQSSRCPRRRRRSCGTCCRSRAPHAVRRPHPMGDDQIGVQMARPGSAPRGSRRGPDDREQSRRTPGTRNRMGQLSAPTGRRRALVR